MLPDKSLTPRARWAWIIFLSLSPLAYAAGLSLGLRYDPNVQAGLAIDRQQAISSASQFAAARGFKVTGWDSFCLPNPDNNRLFYYRLRSGAERDLARRLAPEVVVKVLLRAPDRSENIEVELGADGRPLGFTRNFSAKRPAPDPGEAAARRIAEAAFRARPEAAEVPASAEPIFTENRKDNVLIRRYAWRRGLASLPELDVQFVASVRGETLSGDRVEASLAQDFANRHLKAWPWTRVASVIIYSLAVLVVVIFGLYRFGQRAYQKELSYSRIFLLTCLFASVMIGFILITDVATYGAAAVLDIPAPEWLIIFLAGVFYLMVGLFMGLAYGSGEGDIREAYPGKLTSLDALLTGRVFSRNVGRAVVGGCAFGGWMILTSNLAALLWLGRPNAGRGLDFVQALLSRAPTLAPLLLWPMDTILVTVIGLLLPLPFLRRRLRSPRLVLALLALFVWIACAGPYLGFRPWEGQLLMAALRMAFLLLAFFQFDLLTAIVSLAAPPLASLVVTLAAQPAPSLRQAGVLSGLIALAVLIIEFVCAFKGRLLREHEVRPVYAKNLEERLSLQAEVSAAREAQIRLLPQSLPLTSHFSIAASCLPAHEVGGDFYDFFELDHGKLGVLIAEGGGRGLASALSIAFAKGFLMPKILGDTRADDSPAEVIRGLQDRLTRMLDRDEGVGLAYAVIDTADGTLRYARTGDYPRILVSRGLGRDTQAPDLRPPEERELKFSSSQSAEAITMIEGRCELSARDHVILFTDGLARIWAETKGSPENELAKVVAGDRSASASHLQEALMRVVNASLKRARKQGIEDDLTAVVIRLEHSSAKAAKEGK